MKMKHVTVRTKDLNESIKFYEEIVGIKVQRDLRPGGKIVFMGDTAEDVFVELIENPEEAYEGSGISVGFVADDADGLRMELLEKGYEVTPMISPNPNVRFFFVNDPSGVQIQFLSYL